MHTSEIVWIAIVALYAVACFVHYRKLARIERGNRILKECARRFEAQMEQERESWR